MRTAPSAGATYPLDIYVAVEDIEGIADGLYKFDTVSESPQLTKNGRYFKDICRAALDQAFISASAINLLLVYAPERIVPEYGDDSFKYAAMECGHIAQNLLLMATALGLGAVPVGAFDADKMAKVFGLKHPHEALYLISIGIIERYKEDKA
jgi:SagB-type dehydrogenase family enzyme